MLKHQDDNWFKYLEQTESVSINNTSTSSEGIFQHLTDFSQSELLFSYAVPVTMLVNYSQGKVYFQNVSDIIQFGIDKEICNLTDFHSFLERVEPADLKRYNEEIFPERRKILKNAAPAERTSYVFSSNFRVKNNNGEFVSLLTRSRYLKFDKNANPLLTLTYIINAQHFIKDNHHIHLVEKINKDNPQEAIETVLMNSTHSTSIGQILTDREIEILKLTAKGLTSKEIAVKLLIANNTINNHKQNMLMKTDTRNIMELVVLAIRQKLI